MVIGGPLLVIGGPLLVIGGPLLVIGGPLLVIGGPLLVIGGPTFTVISRFIGSRRGGGGRDIYYFPAGKKEECSEPQTEYQYLANTRNV